MEFINGTLDGPNGPFAEVHDSLTFYMTPDDVSKLVGLASEKGVKVELLPYYVTSAEQVMKQVAQKIAKGNSFGHKS